MAWDSFSTKLEVLMDEDCLLQVHRRTGQLDLGSLPPGRCLVETSGTAPKIRPDPCLRPLQITLSPEGA
jgi:hypothetical protein